jgi:RNA exonuclease 4
MPSAPINKGIYSVPCIINKLPPKCKTNTLKSSSGELNGLSETNIDKKCKKRKRSQNIIRNSENSLAHVISKSISVNTEDGSKKHPQVNGKKYSEKKKTDLLKIKRKQKLDKLLKFQANSENHSTKNVVDIKKQEKKVAISTLKCNTEKKTLTPTRSSKSPKNGCRPTEEANSQHCAKKLKKKRKFRKKKRKATKCEEQVKKCKTPDSSISTSVPKEPSQFSQNWKKLLENMPELKTSNKKNVHKPAPQPDKGASKPEIWFEGVNDALIEQSRKRPLDGATSVQPDTKRRLVRPNSYTGITPIVGLDCEMVGVGPGGMDNMLARVSIVNRFGNCIYDKYVKPTEKVVDYRTQFSGIRPKDLENAEDPIKVQKEVSEILNKKILVGHALSNDLKVLYMSHNRHLIRDTSTYKPFVDLSGGRTPSLRHLTQSVLGLTIQDGEHDSVIDAQAAMRLYTLHRWQWEKDLKLSRKLKKMESSATGDQQPVHVAVAGVSADV